MHGKNPKTAVLVAGGDVGDFYSVWSRIPKGAFIIAVDHGVDALIKGEIRPDLLVGDMDSATSHWETIDCEKILLSPQKDDTDTEMAVNTAIQRGYENIVLVGGTGSRLDHTLGNIEILTSAFFKGYAVSMESSNTSVYWIDDSRPLSVHKREGTGVSLLPIRGNVLGVRTEGLLYPLQGETLYEDLTRGISNEWAAEQAKVSVESGILLAILYEQE